MNSSSSFEISQDTVSSSGGTQTCFSLLFMVLTGLNILRTKYDSVKKKKKRKSDRFLVWRESSQWCGPAPLWFLESGLPRSGGSSPSFAWLVWPARCPSGGPCKKQNGGEREIKLLLQDTKKKKKSSITPTPPRHQLHHGDSLHYRFDTECQISHLLWQLEVIRHQICCVHLKESFKAFVLVVIELLYDITWLCIVWAKFDPEYKLFVCVFIQ